MADRWSKRQGVEVIYKEPSEEEIQAAINKPSSYHPWTQQERDLLRRVYGKTNTRNLIPLFNNRTLESIYDQARRLGIVQERT